MPKVEKNESNIKRCMCPGCPSYNDCARGNSENLYCAKANGKSSCPFEKKGCLCGACPVHAENNLTSGYYCINGSAEEVDGKIEM